MMAGPRSVTVMEIENAFPTDFYGVPVAFVRFPWVSHGLPIGLPMVPIGFPWAPIDLPMLPINCPLTPNAIFSACDDFRGHGMRATVALFVSEKSTLRKYTLTFLKT